MTRDLTPKTTWRSDEHLVDKQQERIYMPKLAEILDRVLAGTIEVDVCGHQINDPVAAMRRWYEHQKAYAAGKGDGKWDTRPDQTPEQIDASMREHYQRDLEHEVLPGEPLAYTSMENYCFGCGGSYRFALRDDRLELRYYWNSRVPNNRPPGLFNSSGLGRHLVDENDCAFSVPKPYGGEIEVGSGVLVFANYFPGLEADSPPDEEHAAEWSLNCLAGRARRCKWKAEQQNVAYGQMGNMSVGIFAHPDKKSIIVGRSGLSGIRECRLSEAQYDALTDGDRAALSRLEDHELRGEISLAVWRWEAADMERLGSNYEKLVADPYRDHVAVDVLRGRWKFTHYYDAESDTEGEHGDVYARLELIEQPEGGA